jgi:glycosyltransferase involved in cell wall biosynthesis
MSADQTSRHRERRTSRLAEGRIAVFLPSLAGGGAERTILNLAAGFAGRGLSVDLVLARAEGPYLADVPGAVRIVDLGSRRVVLSVGPLVSYLRRERPLVMLSALWHANIAAMWARRIAGVPTKILVSAQNTLSQGVGNSPLARAKLTPFLLRRFQSWSDGIVAVSRGVADDLAGPVGLKRERIHVVYNPIITSDFLQASQATSSHPWFAPGQPPVVLGVGRFTWEKDFPNFLRALRLVRDRRRVRGLILGEGSERPELESQVRELGLQDDVQLPGFVENPGSYMARAGAFVLSSRSEGLPTVLVEALALGTPVVATDCRSGPREILKDGRLGALVPIRDPRALADAVIDTLSKPRQPVPAEAWLPYTSEWVVDEFIALMESTLDA